MSLGDRASVTKVALVAHWDWVLHNFRLPVAKALADRGYEVLLVCPRGRYTAGFAEEGFRWIDWAVQRRSMNPVVEWRAVLSLTRIYREEAPDIAHHFTIKPNLYGSIAARRAGVGHVLNTFTGMGFLFSENRKAQVIRLLLKPVMRRMFRSHVSWTIFQNLSDMRLAQKLNLVRPGRSVLIEGTGVDIRRFTPDSSRSSEVPVVLMAARLIREKGVSDFVHAARILRERGVEATFVVAGERDLGNPSSISQHEIDAWATEEEVEFLGHVDDMPALLARADIAALPTYYPEGLPRFLLEAAATGLALVATDIPGCREIVRHGVNGLLVPPHAPQRLADAIARLVQSEELRRRFGSASRSMVEQRFNEADIVRRYLEVYERLQTVSPDATS